MTIQYVLNPFTAKFDAIQDLSTEITGSGTSNQVAYFTGTQSIGSFSNGTSGQVLTSNGSGSAPSFQTPSGGVTSVANSDGTLTISPTTGAVVASLALGHANTWTGQQTFSTSAPIFSTMTLGSVLFAGTSGVLTDDNSKFFYDVTNHRLGLGTASPTEQLHLVDNNSNQDSEMVKLQAGVNNQRVRVGFYAAVSQGGTLIGQFDADTNNQLFSLTSNFTVTFNINGDNILLADSSGKITSRRKSAVGGAYRNTSQDDDTLVVVKRVGIGISNAVASLDVVGYDATLVIGAFTGFSGQSANLGEWRNSSNTVLASVSPTGRIATSSGTSTAYAKVGGVIFDHYVDAGNSTTTETDLYTDTTAANTLAANGDKLEAEYGGTFVSSATATRQVRIYFAGTAILDTGALTLTLSSAWTAYVTLIRVSSTVVRYMVSLTTEGAALAAYTAVGELTGLTLSGTNILKITGQAAGTGAATNDIVGKLGTVYFMPSA